MSEYKRLTNKDWKENYDIFEDICCDTCAEDCGKCERNFNALVRLAELEDKIQNGTLIEIPENVVVLTEQEQNKILKATEKHIDQLKKQVELTRKETAKEILDRINEYNLDYNWDLKEEFKKLCKDYDVEVEDD